MDYMARALDLAEQAKGFCNPNPAVGAVLVHDGRIVGEGFTQPRGQAHAEVVALEKAGPEARGATPDAPGRRARPGRAAARRYPGARRGGARGRASAERRLSPLGADRAPV